MYVWSFGYIKNIHFQFVGDLSKHISWNSRSAKLNVRNKDIIINIRRNVYLRYCMFYIYATYSCEFRSNRGMQNIFT